MFIFMSRGNGANHFHDNVDHSTRRPVAKVCSFFFFSFEQLFNSIQAKFIAVCDSREHYFIISVCRAFIIIGKKMIICKSYVAGNILCEFHTCFLPEDRIYVNSREHVI
jgi:hypothetical protein